MSNPTRIQRRLRAAALACMLVPINAVAACSGDDVPGEARAVVRDGPGFPPGRQHVVCLLELPATQGSPAATASAPISDNRPLFTAPPLSKNLPDR